MHHKENREFTYETGVDEPLNPDPDVAGRMVVKAASNCQNGCKLYYHPDACIVVLGHTSSSGCKRTKNDILDDFTKGLRLFPTEASNA